MQIDMHFYGTFAMAYAAGLTANDALTVATAAQLVDDNNLTELRILGSGQAVLGVATAHHPLDAGKRVIAGGTEDDSRLIWVPFHFLPAQKVMISSIAWCAPKTAPLPARWCSSTQSLTRSEPTGPTCFS